MDSCQSRHYEEKHSWESLCSNRIVVSCDFFCTKIEGQCKRYILSPLCSAKCTWRLQCAWQKGKDCTKRAQQWYVPCHPMAFSSTQQIALKYVALQQQILNQQFLGGFDRMHAKFTQVPPHPPNARCTHHMHVYSPYKSLKNSSLAP